DEWFELVKYSVEKSRELGLLVWLYDENSFPSGFAGGHVARDMPESWNEGTSLEQHKMTKLEPEEGTDYKYIFIKEGDDLVEITDQVEDYIGNEGEFYLYRTVTFPPSKFYGGMPYVDLIHPGVTEKFLEITMTGYEEAIGEDFGGLVPGIFTDEPNIGPAGGRGLIRWTADLFDVFEERWGYDLKKNLNSVIEDEGDWMKIRHDYYETLLQMFIDRWAKPWYEYTEEKGLQWTGHYWEHGWPSPHHGGDNMAMYAWHQTPGIDMLFNTWEGRPDQFGNARNVKELSSVANQFNRVRTLSETYGASGHELTFEDMKRNGDWEYVLGVNLMNQHLSYMTIMGDRKHDFPQTFSRHSPWWNWYKHHNDYYGRLSLSLSSGEQINRILVIEPTTTAWMYYNPAGDNSHMNEMGERFEDFVDEMEMHQVEYDLGCENIMRDNAEVSDGKIQIKHRSYDLLVLPPGLENIENATAQLIEEYLKQGGKILSFVLPPEYVDGVNTGMVKTMLGEYGGQCYTAGSEITPAEIELMQSSDIQFFDPDKYGGLVLHMRREFKDGQLLFLVNSSRVEEASGQFRIMGNDLACLDAETGSVESYPYKRDGDFMEVSFDLPEAGELLVFASDKELDLGEMKASGGEWSEVEPSDQLTVVPASENVLMLDYCFLTMGEIENEEHYFYTASDKIYKHHGFPDNPWVSSAQYKTEIMDRDTFRVDQSGFRADFQFKIVHGVDFSGFRAVVERPGLYTVLVNGTAINALEYEYWLDESFGVFEIGDQLRVNENTISVIANPFSVHCELAPVFILGDFKLEPGKKGWIVMPSESLAIGSWVNQGYPFYHDVVEYTKDYDIGELSANYKVKLDEWIGSLVVVNVNGKEAGIIYHQPYEIDITDLVSSGENQITVKVVGSLRNLLGPHHNNPQYGLVTPWSFKYAPDIQPAGEKYSLLGYGLFGDFEVWKSN
ncbi:MAG: hypothetical protein ISS19_02940, partial [Bacteroidales bacterium]|nr:hypothetical protein [Bacteroidales bacterium]